MYFKSTSPWIFSLYKTSKGKNKDFARQNKFFAMPIPMPRLMPMLMSRGQCRDFQMARFTYFFFRTYISYNKIYKCKVRRICNCYEKGVIKKPPAHVLLRVAV